MFDQSILIPLLNETSYFLNIVSFLTVVDLRKITPKVLEILAKSYLSTKIYEFLLKVATERNNEKEFELSYLLFLTYFHEAK